MTESTRTLCPYCGVDCGLEVSPPAQAGKKINRDSQGKPIWKVQGDRSWYCVCPHALGRALG